MSAHDDHHYNSAATDTPGGYGTDEGYAYDGGRRGSRTRGHRNSGGGYRSRESSGWGLTSDDGGDGDYHYHCPRGR